MRQRVTLPLLARAQSPVVDQHQALTIPLVVFGRDAETQSTDEFASLSGGQTGSCHIAADIGVVPDCLNRRVWRGLVTLTL
jgi:hypothetical protein